MEKAHQCYRDSTEALNFTTNIISVHAIYAYRISPHTLTTGLLIAFENF